MSKEFVKAIISDNNIEAEKAFNDSISAKVGRALETRRKEISQSIVSTNMIKNEKNWRNIWIYGSREGWAS